MQPLEPKITIEVTKFETKFFFVMIIDSQSSRFLHSLANEFEATVLAGSHAEPVH